MKPVVLVVDDDTAICALLQDVLSEHVFTVSVCHTGQEAILRIEGDPDIALVVLDMMLPDTNGLRYCSKSRNCVDIAGGDVDRHGQ